MELKGKKCHGVKVYKDKVMVLLSLNEDGNRKLHPLFLEKLEKPRSLRGLRHYRYDQKPCKEARVTGRWSREGYILLRGKQLAETVICFC
jgi:hypothetical protein